MSVETGDLVFVRVHGEDEPVCVTAWVVEIVESDVVCGTSEAGAASVKQKVTAKAGETTIAFLRVPLEAVSCAKPSGWQGLRAGDIPSLGACRAAWKKAPTTQLLSSDAELEVHPTPQPAKKTARVSEDLKGLEKFLRGDASEEDDEEESEDDDDPGMLPPGQKQVVKSKSKKTLKKEGLDLQSLLAAGATTGTEPKDLLTLLLLNQVMGLQNQKKKKKRRAASSSELLGGSSSEDSESDKEAFDGKGMKAVTSLHRLHEQILRKPRRVREIFEAEVVKELGIVSGQAWTLRDWVKKQNWGRFKGLYRTAIMDVAAYEQLRAGKHEVALAQLIQNLKSKVQAVLANGDWETAWLLTGLPDPLSRKEFSGTKEEMAVISGYVDAMARLKKRVKEAQGQGDADDDEVGGGARK